MIRLKLLAENMLCYKKNMISKINKNNQYNYWIIINYLLKYRNPIVACSTLVKKIKCKIHNQVKKTF
jgi:hypothetical protein